MTEAAGRYAVFIWSAYGVTGIVSAALVAAAVLGHRAQVRALAALEHRLAPRGGAATADE